ncbi:unnamed protein product [Schistosoma rodhaini]|nr:unnamed protein product [Schistosoma rodhaini]
MCNTDQFNLLIEKLKDNPLEEIRCRTLANIQSKLNRGLLPSDKKCLLKLVRVLLFSLEQSPSIETNRIFMILKKLLMNPETKTLFALAGGCSVLTKMRNSTSNSELKRDIDDICVLITEDPSLSGTVGDFKNDFLKEIQTFSFLQTHKGSFNLSTTLGNTNNLDSNHLTSSCSFNQVCRNYLLYFPTVVLTKTDIGVLCTTLKSICSKEPNICISGIRFLHDVVLKDFPAELFLQRTDFIENLFRILNEKNLEIIYSTISCLISFCRALITRIYYHLDPNNYVYSSQTGDLMTSSGPSGTHEIEQIFFTSINDSTQPSICGSATPGTRVQYSYEDVQKQSYSMLDFCFQLFNVIANGLLTVLDHHNQSTKQNASKTSNINTNFSKHNWEYKLESSFLLLFDVGINLLLISLSPHRYTNQFNEVCQNNRTNDPMSFVNSVFLIVPPTVDLIKSSELPPDFYTCMEQLGSILSLYSTNQVHDNTAIMKSLISWNTNEMIDFINKANLPGECERQTYFGLITKIFQLISSLFTPETALAVLPTNVKNQLSFALLDVSLLNNPEPTNESQKIGLPAYVALFNFTIYSNWLLLQQLQTSIFHLIDFLDISEISLLSTSNDQINESNLNLAMDAVSSLEITGSTRFASNFVEFLSQFYVKHQNTSSTVLWRGQLILLRLLSHELVAIRKATYSQILKLLKVAIHPKFAADPSSSLDTVNFLLEDEILCEWINFGLKDENPEVASLACEGFALLLNSYEYISDTGWKKLHHLLIEPASPSPSIKVFRPLTISLGPFAFKEPQTTDLKLNTLGSVALDWCLGRMSPLGRQKIEEQNLDKHNLMNILTSCCRLLLHPINEVRSEAAVAISCCLQFHWRNLLYRPNPTILNEQNMNNVSSALHNCRVVTESGIQVDSECSQKNIYKPDTPVPCFNSGSCAEHLQSQLVTQFNLKPLPLILNREQITSLDFGNKLLEPIECLIQMMKLLADDQINLTARKAAIEQVIIFIRRPVLLSAWRVHHGPEFLVSWFNQVANDLLLLSIQQNPSEMNIFNPTIHPNSSFILLLPYMVHLACLTAIWDTSTRIIFSWEPDFLCSIIYLMNVFPGSETLHRDFVDLITLIAFTPVIQVSNESPICLPQEVVTGYQLPFTCSTYSFRSKLRDPNGNELVGLFYPLSKLANCTNEDQNTKVLCSLMKRNFKFIWAFACHKGLSNFISHTLFMIDSIPDPTSVDPCSVDMCLKRAREYSPFLSQFSLSCLDVTLLLVSHPVSSFILSLSCIRRAANHCYLLESLGFLYRSLSAHKTQYYQWQDINSHNSPNSVNPVMESNKSKDSWWVYAQLDRFMSTLPSCSSDYNLLASVLCAIHEVGLHLIPFSMNYFSNSSKEHICDWLMFLIGDSQGPLSYCLLQPKAGVGETDSPRLVSAKKHLIYHALPCLLSDLFNTIDKLYNITEDKNLNSILTKYSESQLRNICDFKVYEFCFQWACNTLKEFIISPFSDLVRLNLLANILAQLTSPKFKEIVLILNDGEIIGRLINHVSRLLSVFIQQRNHQANYSYIGSSNIVFFLTVINNLIHTLSVQPFIQQLDLNDVLLDSNNSNNNNNDNMNNFQKYLSWIDEEWILQSLTYRQIEVRALALSILSRICLVPIWLQRLLTRNISTETRTLLAAHAFEWSSPGAIWEVAFHFLMDSSESCWVRIMATQLFVNLTALPLNPRDSVMFFPPSINEFTPGCSEQTNVCDKFQFSRIPFNSATLGCRTTSNNIGYSIHDSNELVVDLRDILSSEQSSQQLRDNITQLMNGLKPWTDELFTSEYMMSSIDHQMQSIPVRVSKPPKNTTMPVYSDLNANFYLIGLPALHQLLVSKDFFNYLFRLVISYLPQTMFNLSQWDRLTMPSQGNIKKTLPGTNLTNLQSSTMMKTATTLDNIQEAVTSTITTTETTGTDQSVNSANNAISNNSSTSHIPCICTPSLLSTVIHLLINLMHHLPKFVLSELKLHRINPLLMNIIDPNLLQSAIQQSNISCSTINNKNINCDTTKSLSTKSSCSQLIQCYANCIHILRCQAAMNEECRMNLISDSLFLTRIIIILTIPISYIDLMAPLWQEIFSLITCLLIYSNNAETKGLNLRLILKPLTNVLPNFLNIILTFIDKAELEISKESKYRHSVKFCAHARVALQLLVVIMSHQRPVPLNPVVNRLEKEYVLDTIKSKHPNSDESLNDIVYLTRRLVQLSNSGQCFSQDGTSPRLSSQNSITVIINYRKAIDNALRTLIGICHAIKITALEDGFLEESIAKLQLLRAKMDFCCTNVHVNSESDRSTSCDSKQSLSSRVSIDQKAERRHQTVSTWLKLSDEMIANLEILHNLVYMCPEARMRAIESGIIQVIICIWPLALQDLRILRTTLGLLTNITADCPQASSVLVNPPSTIKVSPYIISQSNQISGSSNIQGNILKTDDVHKITAPIILFNASNSLTINSSFIQSLCNLIPTYNQFTLTESNIKCNTNTLGITSKIHQFNSCSNIMGNKQSINTHQEDIYKLIFQLLANMVWAPETRSFLLKSKILNQISELNPRTLIKSRRGHFILTLWLQLILNISFTKDGQHILFNQPNLPTILINCINHCKPDNRVTALVILRNLCTHSILKSKLLTTNFGVINCFRDILLDSHLDANSLYTITVVLSAIEASIHNSKKIRVFMKSNSCLRHLTNFWESYQVRNEFLSVFPRVRSLIMKLQG